MIQKGQLVKSGLGEARGREVLLIGAGYERDWTGYERD